MASGADELRRLMHSLLRRLEVEDWPGTLELTALHEVAGKEDLVRGVAAVRFLARSMHRRTQGRVDDAWDLLDDVTAQLPRMLRGTSCTGRGMAVVPREPDPDADAHLVWRLARLCRREQIELEDFRARFAPAREVPARAVLIEAYREYMVLIEFNPFVCRPRRKRTRNPDDALPVELSRKALCGRATALRRLGDPAGRAVSQSVWQDIGGLEGLRAEALDSLAEQPGPARWLGQEKAAGLVVRRGDKWAWEFAHGEELTA